MCNNYKILCTQGMQILIGHLPFDNWFWKVAPGVDCYKFPQTVSAQHELKFSPFEFAKYLLHAACSAYFKNQGRGIGRLKAKTTELAGAQAFGISESHISRV